MADPFEKLLSEEECTSLRARITQSPTLYGLTVDERMALWLWSTGSAEHAVIINARLRAAQPLLEYSGMATRISRALHRLPYTKGYVYRGIRVPDPLEVLKRYRVGSVVEWPAFTCCSGIEERAFNGNMIFKIKSRYGHSIAAFVADFEEQEVLFRQRSRFRVVRVATGLPLVIEMEQP